MAKRDEANCVPGLVLPSPYCDVIVSDAVWGANTGRLSIEKYSLDGKFISAWGKPGVGLSEFPGCCNPAHIARTPSGGFVTSEKGLLRIKEFDGSGKFIGLITRPGDFHPTAHPPAVAVDNAGRVYALDTYRKAVRVFERTVKGR